MADKLFYENLLIDNLKVTIDGAPNIKMQNYWFVLTSLPILNE